jgi:hypothetical protein
LFKINVKTSDEENEESEGDVVHSKMKRLLKQAHASYNEEEMKDEEESESVAEEDELF